MLMAMRNSNFAVIRVERVHAIAGLVATDVHRQKEIWLVDEAMERTIPRGMVIATRLFTPESFSMTAGVALPLDARMLRDMIDDVPQLDRDQLVEMADDRRFMETVYRIALERGARRGSCTKTRPTPGVTPASAHPLPHRYGAAHDVAGDVKDAARSGARAVDNITKK
jgi:hypothetical protein